MRIARTLSTLAVAALGLLAGNARAQEPIRIGVLQPLTGPSTKNGIENWTAMQIARDMINERGGDQGAQDRVRARRYSEPDRGDQRDRTPDHQGWRQDHDRLGGLAAGDPGQPGRRTSRRVPLGDGGRGRHHHQARLQIYVPGRSGGLSLQPGRGELHARRAHQERSASRRPTCASRCCGKTAPSANRLETRSAATPSRRASSSSTTRATTNSPPT